MSAYYQNDRMGNGRLANDTSYYEGDRKRDRANGGEIIRKHTTDQREKKPFILNRISNAITSTLENGFYWVGHLVGLHPWKTVFISAIVMGVFGAGFHVFKDNTDSTGLWVPNNAKVLDHKDWVSDKFPSTVRSVAVLFVNSDVLTPAALKSIYEFYKKSLDLKTSSNKNYSDVCLKSGNLCRVNSVLELWKYNESDINGITTVDVKTKLNNTTQSPTYFNDFDPTTVLGGTTKDGSGNIIEARAAKVTWLLQGGSASSVELEDAKLWEEKAINLALKGQSGISNVYVTATRSFSDKAGDAISSDVVLLSTGYLLVIVFVIVILGRFNFLEFGLGISISGILVIGISIVFCYGLASIAGWEYTPLHSILPFLLLGIGVDDLFVVVMAYKSLPPVIAEKPIPERIAMTLKHAGVSITVTSLTDMCAFGIGATTVLPALKSFCIFACLGILALYLLSATFFVACVALNAQRHDAKRNSIICCLKHSPEYQPNQCSRKEIIVIIFKKFYGPIITTLPVKIFVILSTLALLGVGIWGFVSLKQESDPIWFLPTDSYPFIYDSINTKYFPSSGDSASVYCKGINYFESKSKFDKLHTDMTSSKYIASGTTDSWFKSFTDWLSSTTDADVIAKLNNKYPVNETDFYSLLHHFITTNPAGLRHKRQIKFSNTSTLTITASYIPFRHTDLKTSFDKVEGMDSTNEMIEKIFTSGECFPYGRRYLNWFTNKVIQMELYRNLGVAAACVFVVCLVLIANIFTSLLVFSCVLFTLLDVGGMMHFWNMTIDTVTSIILILAIGLAVDYSAHIGHCFMTFTGNRNDRVKSTLVEMGSPVFSGGVSTFLAFVLLAGSNSYVFTTFFKVFFLVVLFGLFHGLVYLPTMLSLIGPSAYLSADRGQANEEVSLDIRADRSKVSVQGVDNPVMHIKQQRLAFDGPPAYDFFSPVKDVTAYIPPPDYSPPAQPRFYRGPVDRQNIYSIR